MIFGSCKSYNQHAWGALGDQVAEVAKSMLGAALYSSRLSIHLFSVCCNTDIRGVVMLQEKGSVAGLVFANWRIADILQPSTTPPTNALLPFSYQPISAKK